MPVVAWSSAISLQNFILQKCSRISMIMTSWKWFLTVHATIVHNDNKNVIAVRVSKEVLIKQYSGHILPGVSTAYVTH